MTPELIEPVKITIEQIDKSETPFPSGPGGIREPRGHIVRKTAFDIDAQVVFLDRQQLASHTQLGTDEQIKGYCIVRFKDLSNLGKVLQRGDKITKMGQLDRELFILHSEGDPAAHFTNDQFTLVRMFFGDREPPGDRIR